MVPRALLMLIVSVAVSSFHTVSLRYTFVHLAAEFMLEAIGSGSCKRIGPKDWAQVRHPYLVPVTHGFYSLYVIDLRGLAQVPGEQADDQEDQER